MAADPAGGGNDSSPLVAGTKRWAQGLAGPPLGLLVTASVAVTIKA
ncbi:MAG: hypothetical protein M0005_18315 [Actinomycetota bacterium]|nr:hypothetical protein [Actinomycetota bacterium]